MLDEQIIAAMKRAIQRVRDERPPLEFAIVHERSTAHRLAVQMEHEFGTWNVDCEYDRDAQVKKAIEGLAGCRAARRTDDFMPDVIVHHRFERGREHNLLVIELKKQAAQDYCDQLKLELLTSPTGPFAYQLGLYINIDGGAFTCTWYKNGETAALV